MAGAGEGLGGGGGNEPAIGGVDEFWDAGDTGSDDGACKGEGFHEDHGEAFGEAGEDEAAGREEEVMDGGGALPAFEMDDIRKV